MKSLVVYKSISGFTKRYAGWISEELKADCLELDAIDLAKLPEYDLVIFGGSLHAVGINGYKRFRSYYPRIGYDRVIVFAVGASPAKEGLEEELKAANFSEEEEKSVPLFYLRGGFDFSKLNFPNKILMKLLQWKLTFKKDKTADERGMLAAYRTPLDVAKKKATEALLAFVKAKFPER